MQAHQGGQCCGHCVGLAVLWPADVDSQTTLASKAPVLLIRITIISTYQTIFSGTLQATSLLIHLQQQLLHAQNQESAWGWGCTCAIVQAAHVQYGLCVGPWTTMDNLQDPKDTQHSTVLLEHSKE